LLPAGDKPDYDIWRIGDRVEVYLERRHGGDPAQCGVPMNIIVKKDEKARLARHYAEQTRKHYYGREIRDGSRFRSKAGTKEQIKKALETS